MEKEVVTLNLEISKAKQEEFEAQEELLDTRRELDEANQQIEQLKVISYEHPTFILSQRTTFLVLESLFSTAKRSGFE